MLDLAEAELEKVVLGVAKVIYDDEGQFPAVRQMPVERSSRTNAICHFSSRSIFCIWCCRTPVLLDRVSKA